MRVSGISRLGARSHAFPAPEGHQDPIGPAEGIVRQNPPEVYEKHRNGSIFERQGNRNPLIDRPDWAEKIDFSVGIG